MSILRGIFRHHEEDVWRQLSEGVDGDFIHEKGWRNDRVVCKAGEWIIVVDLHTTVGYKSEHVSTRFHTTLPNPDKFNFTVHHKSIFERVAHFFGSHDIHVGDEVFDKEYEVRANREEMVKQLLANEKVRTIIKTEPTLSLRLGPVEGEVTSPTDMIHDEMTLMVDGEVNDVDRLKNLYTLYCEVLHGLSELFPAISDPA